jgi:hypothetical protein
MEEPPLAEIELRADLSISPLAVVEIILNLGEEPSINWNDGHYTT